MVLHYKIHDGQTIQYCDVMGIFQLISKYFKVPSRDPKIHVGDASRDKEAMLSKEVLIKCTVLCPKRFYHPVLLFRCNNKSNFLCITYAIEWNFSGEFVLETVEEIESTKWNMLPRRDSVVPTKI